MQYQLSYRQAFSGPEWAANLLYCSGCVLVPFVGWAVLIGYAIEGLEQRARGLSPTLMPFAPDRWREYLMRGLWPTIVQALVVMPALVLLATSITLVLSLKSAGHGQAFLHLLATGLAAGLLFLALALTMLLLPLTIYTALGGVGDLAVAGQFIRAFLRAVGFQVFLAQVFLISTGLALAIVGLVLCAVGLPPALALITLAQYHLMAQLYAVYLGRGGPAVAAFQGQAVPTGAF